MTLAVPYSASITYSWPATLADGCASAGDDMTRILMDAALERIEAARDADEVDTASVQSAVAIVLDLRDTLDLPEGGEIAVNVAELYDYMCRRLRSAGLRNGTAALDEVSHLLQALRSAWAFYDRAVARESPVRDDRAVAREPPLWGMRAASGK